MAKQRVMERQPARTNHRGRPDTAPRTRSPARPASAAPSLTGDAALASPANLQMLQTQAGNHAVGTLLGATRRGSVKGHAPAHLFHRDRPVVLRQATKAPVKSLPPKSPASGVTKRSIARAGTIADLQSLAIVQLKEASKRLRADADAYKKAYADYYGTLKEADTVHARAEKASDFVEGIVIGSVVNLLGPAAFAARMARPLAGLTLKLGASAAKPALAQLTSAGKKLAEGAVDEGFENVGGALLGTVSSDTAPPSGSAGLGGHHAGAQFEQALHELDGLVASFPNLMPLQKAVLNVAQLAQTASETGDEALARLVVLLDKQSDVAVKIMTAMLTEPFRALIGGINARPKRSKADIEYQLWTEWAARLSPPYDELNYKVVRNRLEKIGLGALLFQATTGPMTGPYAGEKIVEKSRRRITMNARVEWLRARGIELPGHTPWKPMDTAVDLLFSTAQRVEQVEKELAGQRNGTYEGGGKVSVGGRKYRVFGLVPPAAEVGTKVVIDDVSPPFFYLRILAKEYATKGMHSMNRFSAKDVGLSVRWQIHKGYPPFKY